MRDSISQPGNVDVWHDHCVLLWRLKGAKIKQILKVFLLFTRCFVVLVFY